MRLVRFGQLCSSCRRKDRACSQANRPCAARGACEPTRRARLDRASKCAAVVERASMIEVTRATPRLPACCNNIAICRRGDIDKLADVPACHGDRIMRALNTAATGRMAQELKSRFVSTTSPHAQRLVTSASAREFRICYTSREPVGHADLRRKANPACRHRPRGRPSRPSVTPRIMTQGTSCRPAMDFDVAIRAERLFHDSDADGQVRLQRAGSFRWTRRGRRIVRPPRQCGCSPA